MAVEVRATRETDGVYVAVAFDTDARWSTTIARSLTESEAKESAVAAAERAVAQSDRVVSATLLRCRTGLPGETYEEYLEWHGLLGGGFSYRELVRHSTRDRHLLPPATLWPNIVAALALAHLLRAIVVEHGGHGLNINAAHRLTSPSKGSKHKLNAALDLDLLSSDVDLAGVYLEIGARVWRDHKHLRIGMGSYHPARTRRTRRLHVDAKVRWRRAVWQYSGDRKIRRPAIAAIARRL